MTEIDRKQLERCAALAEALLEAMWGFTEISMGSTGWMVLNLHPRQGFSLSKDNITKLLALAEIHGFDMRIHPENAANLRVTFSFPGDP